MTDVMREVGFFVPGDPAPQGSKSAFTDRRTGRVVMVEANAQHGAWRDKVATVAALKAGTRQRAWQPLDGALRSELTFYLPRPPSVPRTRRERPSVPPDIDKLVRSVHDSLTTARIWTDDARVVSLHADAYYDDDHPPGVRVYVNTIGATHE